MRLSFLLPLLLTMHGASGQWQLQFDGNIPVSLQGATLDLAWAGGLNSVQLNTIDLDGDGLKDLLLFDRSGNRVITLLNTGGPGTSGFTLTRAYDDQWPFTELKDWVLLRDYDGDGLEDIFTYSIAGFAVYRNTSSGGDLAFELVDPQVRSCYMGPSGNCTFANLFISAIDLPGIVDVDGDGDIDILTFSLFGTTVEYHKNLSMELYGHADSLVYELRNKCWGFFLESFSDNSITLDFECDFNVPAPEIGTGSASRIPNDPGGDRAHAGSALTPLDLNGDGVMDLLLGDIAYNNITALTNGGTTTLATMVAADTAFPGNTPVDLPVFPAAFHVDVDNDGARDLVVSPNATSLSHNYKSMWYYRNTGTDLAPDLQFQQDDLFQGRMLDFGEGAFPVPFDHDSDGLMDLVVANHGYFNAGGTYFGRLALLRNTGTAQEPAFTLVTDDYQGLGSMGLGLSMYPAFGDLDGDGRKDMVVGDLQGNLHHFRNTGTGPEAEFELEQITITDATGAVIDLGQFATPQLIDMDEDGLLDMIIGERNGNLNYYRNTGTAQVPAWTLVSEELGGVNTAEYWNITGYSVPFLFRNAMGDREILLGSESGWLYHYGDIEGNVDGQWTLLDSTFLDVREGIRTGVCLHDFTGDGEPDLVIGNYRGGLSFWRSDEPSGVGMDLVESGPAFMLWPNPSNGAVHFDLPGYSGAGGEWVICNGMGQVVHRQPVLGRHTVADLGALSSGLYLVRLEGRGSGAARRLVIARGER